MSAAWAWFASPPCIVYEGDGEARQDCHSSVLGVNHEEYDAMISPVRHGRVAGLLAVAVAASLGVSACSSSGGSSSGGGNKSVKIVAFSVPKPAYDALETAFAKTSAGKGVQFSQS